MGNGQTSLWLITSSDWSFRSIATYNMAMVTAALNIQHTMVITSHVHVHLYNKLPLCCLNGQNAVNKPVTLCPDKEAEQPSAGNTYKWAAKNFEEYSWLILTVRYSMLEFVTVSNAEIESAEKFWA